MTHRTLPVLHAPYIFGLGGALWGASRERIFRKRAIGGDWKVRFLAALGFKSRSSCQTTRLWPQTRSSLTVPLACTALRRKPTSSVDILAQAVWPRVMSWGIEVSEGWYDSLPCAAHMGRKQLSKQQTDHLDDALFVNFAEEPADLDMSWAKADHTAMDTDLPADWRGQSFSGCFGGGVAEERRCVGGPICTISFRLPRSRQVWHPKHCMMLGRSGTGFLG